MFNQQEIFANVFKYNVFLCILDVQNEKTNDQMSLSFLLNALKIRLKIDFKQKIGGKHNIMA